MPWGRVAIADVVLTSGDPSKPWDISSVAMSGPKVLGIGSQKIVGPGYLPKMPIIGQHLLNVLAKHDVVCLQHWPHPSFITTLKDVGVKKVLLWVDWRCVPNRQPSGYWSPWQHALGTYMQQNPLRATKPNRFGHNVVDVYEMALPNDWQQKPHCTMVDYTNPKFAEWYTQVLGSSIQPYRGLIDGLLFDDCLDHPYPGTATNMPEMRAVTFVQCLTDILAWSKKLLFGEIWGNCGPIEHYAGLDGRWNEMGLTGSAVDEAKMIKTQIERVEKARGGKHMQYIVNMLPSRTAWAWSNMNFDILKAQLGEYNDRVSMVTFRTGADGTCLCPDVAGF